MPAETELGRVLVVDDEPAILDGLRRRLRGRFEVQVAASGAEALALLGAGEAFDVVVSDMRMPVMNGAELLGRIRERVPDTVRILLTGYSEVDAAIDAINRGQIFRFLTKPVDGEVLLQALDDAVRQHRLVVAEQELLEQTLHGSVAALLETLSLANAAAFARAVLIKDTVAGVLEGLDVENRWEIEVASMLSQLGAVTLPDETVVKLHFGLPLAEHEQAMVDRLPEVADRLLATIPRLEGVRRIIAEQAGSHPSRGTSLGGTLLRLVVAFQGLVAAGADPEAAISTLRARSSGDALEADLIGRLDELSAAVAAGEVTQVRVEELAPGMVLQGDVRSSGGTLIVGRGQVVTESLLARLHNYAEHDHLSETVPVLVSS